MYRASYAKVLQAVRVQVELVRAIVLKDTNLIDDASNRRATLRSQSSLHVWRERTLMLLIKRALVPITMTPRFRPSRFSLHPFRTCFLLR